MKPTRANFGTYRAFWLERSGADPPLWAGADRDAMVLSYEALAKCFGNDGWHGPPERLHDAFFELKRLAAPLFWFFNKLGRILGIPIGLAG